MRWSHNVVRVALLLGLACAAPALAKDEKKDADKKSQSDKKKEAKRKESKKDAPPAGQADDANGRMSLPSLVPGHDSIGLRIPYYDGSGKLQMKFTIGIATRLDPDHVRMKETQVETFSAEGESEMTVDLPESVLDLNTRVVTSNTRTTIKRSDFMIVGDSVAFNTQTKQGKLVGNVHMTIYDLGEETDGTAKKPE